MRSSLLVLAFALLAAVGLVPATPAAAVEVGAGADRYSGTGGVILPGGVDSGTRREASSCTDCHWRLSDPCADDGGPCLAVTRGCAQLASLLRILLSTDGGATWSDRGLVCIAPTGPVTVRAVSSALRQEFERIVPALAPRVEPSAGIVTRIPVNFITGQPRGLPPSAHQVLGQTVRLNPSVRWSWEFGDGVRQETADPGAPYPAGSIRHAYRRAGVRVAQVLARWTGSFEVDGLGPFPVAGDITQMASVEVSVGEGRAVLVP